jgi:zinc transporter ZupT
MENSVAATRRTNTYKTNLISGLAVHSVAALTCAIVTAADLEGCDRGDGLAAALALALTVDVVLAGVTLLIMRGRNRNNRSAALKAWATSSLLAVALLATTIVYLMSLPSGCPV